MGATLFINQSDAFCGDCNKPADSKEAGHYTIPGFWKREDEEGCGAVYTHVGSHYSDTDDGWFYKAIQAMRPDLEWDNAWWSQLGPNNEP